MRIELRRLGWLGCLITVAACAAPTEKDRCEGVVCDRPPGDECRDEHTALHYRANGECRPETGQCEYGAEEETCYHGCVDGSCQAEDKCRGIICDKPPPNECLDAGRLKIYQAVGNCDPATGQCDYGFREKICQHGCLEGLCQDEDLCQGVTCIEPPADTCLNESTLLVYDPEGTCNPDDGRCQYASGQQTCEQVCQEGACVDDRAVWGYVAVIESSDIPCFDTYFEWCSPVRAYLAADTCHTLVLPHHLDAICTQVNKQAVGGCTLYTDCDKGGPGSRLSCAGGCPPNQECVGWFCKDLAPVWDVGTITIDGLKVPVELSPDQNGRYAMADPPADLFDAGSPISVESSGGVLMPFSLSASGVADLEIDSSEVLLEAGQPAAIRWTPADPDAQVQVVLYAGWHFPLTPQAAIVCEADDEAGRIEVPAEFVDRFKEYFMFVRYSRITRFTRQAIIPYQKDIELFVGQARLLAINNP